jgi:hypothetical protein
MKIVNSILITILVLSHNFYQLFMKITFGLMNLLQIIKYELIF